VLGTLVLVMPFSGMRVICLDSPADASNSSAPAAPAPDDCERVCALHQPASGNGSHCALSPDASSLLVFAGAAVVRPLEPPQVPLVVTAVYAEVPRFRPEPELARFVPPPEHQAL
jgi:hypothetical protein